MYLTEESGLEQKWGAILDHPNMPKIRDPYRRSVTAIVLENQEQANITERQELFETAPANSAGAMPNTGGVAKWDPVLISLVRRALPQLLAYDICGVQPMQMPTGLIFAMKSKYTSQGGTEAMFDEVNSAFTGTGAQFGTNPSAPSAITGTITVATNSTAVTGVGTAFTTQLSKGAALYAATGAFLGTVASVTDATNAVLTANALSAVTGAGALAYSYGQSVTTAIGEDFGGATTFPQMAFSIEKTTVTAQTRALKAEYSLELAQDLKAVHGLDAESELTNILSQEILAEINREVLRSIYVTAVPGARAGVVTTAGQFDLDIDSNGRWSVEKFKGLLFQIERDCNDIAQTTRRGKGNFIICSSDVASALSLSGKLDYAPALNTDLGVDDTGSTFCGMLNGSIKVFIDPYSANYGSQIQFYVAGYRGSSPYDAGIFYSPYVPLQMVRATDPNTFQPKIGFKTRYGMVANPYAAGNGAIIQSGLGEANANVYFRKVQVLNLS
jgi:hypothetical protein